MTTPSPVTPAGGTDPSDRRSEIGRRTIGDSDDCPVPTPSGDQPAAVQQPAQVAVQRPGQVQQAPGVQPLGAALDRADEVAAHPGPRRELLLPEVEQRTLAPDPVAHLAPERLLAVRFLFLIGTGTPDG